jgi:hypothetical protein
MCDVSTAHRAAASSSRFGKKFVSQARIKRCEAKSSGRKLDPLNIVHYSRFRKDEPFIEIKNTEFESKSGSIRQKALAIVRDTPHIVETSAFRCYSQRDDGCPLEGHAAFSP